MARLVFIIILFLVSLLTIFGAPAYYLWLLAVGVTEFPWLFAGITLVMVLTGFWVTKYQVAGNIIGIVALLLFLSPIMRAYMVADGLKEQLEASFGPPHVKNDAAPFSFLQMFGKNIATNHSKLTYVTYKDTSLTLDFYQGKTTNNTGKQPCVIVVHGGSWAGGNSQQLPELNPYLAFQGYNVASINYRMAPKWQTPAPVEDVANALKYLCANADKLHIDTTQFILLGRSAGAQIALLAAYTLHNKNIVGVVDFYGPADMVWGYSVPASPLIMDSRKVMERYIGGTYKQVPQKYTACSPLQFVGKNSPPTLIIHGDNDVLVAPEHSTRLNEKLKNNNIKHFWLKLPWATHGFDFNLNGPGGQLSTYSVLQFLNSITK